MEEVKTKIERALSGLLTAKIIQYELDGSWITISVPLKEKGYGYNITAVPIEAMIKEGFHLLMVSLNQDNRPVVIFTTYKV